MTKQYVSFMMVRGDVYSFIVYSDVGLAIMNKMAAMRKQMDETNEKIKREQKLNNF